MAKQPSLLVNMPDPELVHWIRVQAAIEERKMSAMVRLLLKMARRQLEKGEPLIEEPGDGSAA